MNVTLNTETRTLHRGACESDGPEYKGKSGTYNVCPECFEKAPPNTEIKVTGTRAVIRQKATA